MEWNTNSEPSAISTGSCVQLAQSSPWLLPAITDAIFSSVGSASSPACVCDPRPRHHAPRCFYQTEPRLPLSCCLLLLLLLCCWHDEALDPIMVPLMCTVTVLTPFELGQVVCPPLRSGKGEDGAQPLRESVAVRCVWLPAERIYGRGLGLGLGLGLGSARVRVATLTLTPTLAGMTRLSIR